MIPRFCPYCGGPIPPADPGAAGGPFCPACGKRVPGDVGVPLAACASCGSAFPAGEMARFGDQAVCAGCKPDFVRRLKEGGAVPGVAVFGGFWIRTAAKIIDSMVLWLANTVLITLPSTLLIGAGGGDNLGAVLGFIAQITLSLVLSAGYEIWFLANRGATPGKMALGLKVVRADMSPLTYGRATGRFFAQFVSALTLYFGYFMAGWDPQKRALHDRICDTRVIRVRA